MSFKLWSVPGPKWEWELCLDETLRTGKKRRGAPLFTRSDSEHSAMAAWKSQEGAERTVAPPISLRGHTDTDLSLHSLHATPFPVMKPKFKWPLCPLQNAAMLQHWRRNEPEQNAPEGILCTGLRGLGRVAWAAHKKMQNEDPGFQTQSDSGPLLFSGLFLSLRKRSIQKNDFLLYVGQFLLRS